MVSLADPPVDVPDGTTRSLLKRRVFAEDLFFREAWDDALGVLDGDIADTLHRAALLMFKPDAVAGRRVDAVLDFAVAHGFEPVWASPLRLNRHSMRELWRYDWHVYPVDRLRFCSFWYPAAPTMVLALRDTASHPARPAAERLSELKGSSLPGERQASSLRSVLQPPNQILNFVHVADEPMDLIREAGILLDGAERRRFLGSFGSSERPDPDAISRAVASTYAQTPSHDLDFEGGVGRLEDLGVLDQPLAARLRAAAHGRGTVGWDEISRIVKPSMSQSAIWDVIAVASAVIPLERTDPPRFSWTDTGQPFYSGQSSLPPGGITLVPPGRS